MSLFAYCPRGSTSPDGRYHYSIDDMNDMLKNHPWDSFVKPFRCAPHVWEVSGFYDVCSYLLDTGEGLILIDCPSINTLYLQLESIRSLGFDPREIKCIFVTHAHLDHYGAVRALKEYTGATVYLSKEDTEDYNTRMKNGTQMNAPEFGMHPWQPDKFYDTEKPFVMGRFSIQIRICPGHSAGPAVFRFEDTGDNGRTYKIAMHGGMGATATTEGLKKGGYPLSFHQRFITDCEEMAHWDVDICLASHENQTNFYSGVNEEDRNDFSGFVDKNVWKNLLLGRAEAVREKG